MSETQSELIDVRFLVRVIVRWGWIALILATIGGYNGLRDARGKEPQYKASMIVMPESGSVGVSNSVAQIGSVLGINVQNSGSGTTFDRLELMIGSLRLAERLQEKFGLLQMIYASSWDEDGGKWIEPTAAQLEQQNRLARFLGLPVEPWHAPDTETLANFLRGALQFERAGSKRFIEVSVKNRDPDFALQLLELVYEEADAVLREADLSESKERMIYINARLAQAKLVDSRQALIGLLTSEERRAMLLETDLPYAARIIDLPFVSKSPEQQGYLTVIVVPALLLGAISLAFILLIALYRKT